LQHYFCQGSLTPLKIDRRPFKPKALNRMQSAPVEDYDQKLVNAMERSQHLACFLLAHYNRRPIGPLVPNRFDILTYINAKDFGALK